MPIRAAEGLLVTLPGGHPTVILSAYPPQPTDLVIFANLTHVDNIEGATLLFGAGYRLSSGFMTTEDSTIYPQIRKCTRAQADDIVARCRDCGFISRADLSVMRSYVATRIALISDKSVRDEIVRLGW